MFSHSFTEREGHKVLAVCDEDLLGEEISDEKFSIEVSESFYGGGNVSEEKLLEMAEESTIINAVGNEVVELLVKEGFFEDDKILKIDGVNHAQMVRIQTR